MLQPHSGLRGKLVKNPSRGGFLWLHAFNIHLIKNMGTDAAAVINHKEAPKNNFQKHFPPLSAAEPAHFTSVRRLKHHTQNPIDMPKRLHIHTFTT